MTAEQKVKYVKLLQNQGSPLSEAILFYLTIENPEFSRKQQFVEKVLDKYAETISVSAGGKFEERIILASIPREIKFQLVTSHEEYKLTVSNNEDEDLITEMNEIF